MSTISTKSLERKLKQIRKEEALVNKWLNWLTLSIALLYWVLDGGALGTASSTKTTSKNRTSVSTSRMGWIGGGIALTKLGVKWYYMRRKREIEVELLEREPVVKEKSRKKDR